MNPSPINLPGNVKIRASVEDDQAVLFKLFTECHDELLVAISNLDAMQQESFLQLQFQAQRAQYRQRYPDAHQDMIVNEGKIIGQILIARGDEICLVDLSLLPEYRNLGIGSALLQDLLNEAEVAGKCVNLHVMQSNPAVRLYQRLGFDHTGEDGIYRRMEWIPVLSQGVRGET